MHQEEKITHGNFLFSFTKIFIDMDSKRSISAHEGILRNPVRNFFQIVKKKARTGQNYHKSDWLQSAPETPKWVKDPGNGFKSILGS